MSATLVRRTQLAKTLNVHPATIPKLVARGAIPPQIAGTQYWVLEEVEARLRGRLREVADDAKDAFNEWKRSRDARSA